LHLGYIDVKLLIQACQQFSERVTQNLSYVPHDDIFIRTFLNHVTHFNALQSTRRERWLAVFPPPTERVGNERLSLCSIGS